MDRLFHELVFNLCSLEVFLYPMELLCLCIYHLLVLKIVVDYHTMLLLFLYYDRSSLHQPLDNQLYEQHSLDHM